MHLDANATPSITQSHLTHVRVENVDTVQVLTGVGVCEHHLHMHCILDGQVHIKLLDFCIHNVSGWCGSVDISHSVRYTPGLFDSFWNSRQECLARSVVIVDEITSWWDVIVLSGDHLDAADELHKLCGHAL